MSREENLRKMADISNEWRQLDIEIGVKQEQERIIKLLETELAKLGKSLDADSHNYWGVKHSIELIKGEQK